MKIRILIQARMSSSRLPGKSLLPIAGIPLAILCSLRTMKNYPDVMIVTSDDNSDDILVDEAEKYGVKIFRGSLCNVLSRFTAAVDDLSNNDIIVRLTADNPIVDHDFVNIIIEEFKQHQLDYMGTSSPVDGLPYGLSAEVMLVSALRKADKNAVDSYDREHVTPWIKVNMQANIVNGKNIIGDDDLSYLRCTVDTFEDFINVNNVFKESNENPINTHWKKLIEILNEMPTSPNFHVPYRNNRGTLDSIITLGTVQFGLKYGVANQNGMPGKEKTTSLIRKAIVHGVNWIDTASAYGLAEARVGQALSGGWSSRVRVVTKLDTLIEISDDDSVSCVENAVNRSLIKSQNALGMNELDVVLLHRWAHRISNDGTIWNLMLKKKSQGLIKELGVSVYSPEETIEALLDKNITHIQLPFNLLDHRWLAKDVQDAFNSRPDVRIHARSVFLQGLLINDEKIWPTWHKESGVHVECINQLVKDFGRESKADLCLAYVLSQKWIDSIVIGVETDQQLLDDLKVVRKTPLNSEQCKIVNTTFSNASVRLLNPSLW